MESPYIKKVPLYTEVMCIITVLALPFPITPKLRTPHHQLLYNIIPDSLPILSRVLIHEAVLRVAALPQVVVLDQAADGLVGKLRKKLVGGGGGRVAGKGDIERECFQV